MRAGYKYGNVTMVDTLLKDCLVDPFHDCHMGNTGMSVSCELWNYWLWFDPCIFYMQILIDSYTIICTFALIFVFYS